MLSDQPYQVEASAVAIPEEDKYGAKKKTSINNKNNKKKKRKNVKKSHEKPDQVRPRFSVFLFINIISR